MSTRYIKPTEDTTWPDPGWVGRVGWGLRYSAEPVDAEDRRFLASVCAAYVSLATHPCGEKQLTRLRRCIQPAALPTEE